MAKPMTWHILSIKSGRELFLHEMFVKNGFAVYTPFEKKFQRPVSRKSRAKRTPPVCYAEALFKGFLFVGSDLSPAETFLGVQYILDRRSDAYKLISHMGEPLALSERNMSEWQGQMAEHHAKRPNFVIRGYDPKRDARKNRTRLYGQDAITIPTFTEGEKVRFMSGSFEGLTAEVSEVDGEAISVLLTIFGAQHKVQNVDVYEIRKAG